MGRSCRVGWGWRREGGSTTGAESAMISTSATIRLEGCARLEHIRCRDEQRRPRSAEMTPHDRPAPPRTRRAWVLLSGGIDSVACLAFYLKGGFRVRCLHVNLGQPGSSLEQAAAEQVAQHYAAPITTLRWEGSVDFTHAEILGRNALLLTGGLMEIGGRTGLLAIGIHSGTPYFDCTGEFLFSMQTIVDGYCDGRVKIVAPFLKWSKQQVIAFCKSERIPIALTYSCERGTWPPCRECTSCVDRSYIDAM